MPTVMEQPPPFVEEIDFKEIEVLEVVGKGSFGVVSKGRWRNKFVAIKKIETEAEKKAFIVEVRQLSLVCHPNIVKLYGACTKSTVCLVMEYAEGGSLYNVLHGTPQPVYTAAHAMSWSLQCAKGVAYLHGMKPKALIHRDLKPPNLLLIMGGTVLKICDFGTACALQTHMTNNKGSAAWMAPEVFEGCKYSEKCDVFSWGIILWEVLTRRKPFDEIGGPAFRIMWAVHSGQRPPLIKGCPPDIELLMTSCWDKDPLLRPSMEDVVKSMAHLFKFFKGAEEPIIYPETDIQELRESESDEGITNSDGNHRTAFNNEDFSELNLPLIPPHNLGTLSSNNNLSVPEKQIAQTSAPPSLATSLEKLSEIPNNFPNREINQKRYSADFTSLRAEELIPSATSSRGHRRTGSHGSVPPGFVNPNEFLAFKEYEPVKPFQPKETSFFRLPENIDVSLPLQNNGPNSYSTIDIIPFMLDPQFQPLPPCPTSPESMKVYGEHIKMAHEYIRVQKEKDLLKQRKKELTEELNKSSDVLSAPQFTSNYKALQELNELKSEQKSLLELHHNLKKQLEILKQKKRCKNSDEWEMV